MKPYENTIAKILADPSASYWLKNALKTSLERDCVDAARDAQILSEILGERCTELLVDSIMTGRKK